jgi:hypothetical protein
MSRRSRESRLSRTAKNHGVEQDGEQFSSCHKLELNPILLLYGGSDANAAQ